MIHIWLAILGGRFLNVLICSRVAHFRVDNLFFDFENFAASYESFLQNLPVLFNEYLRLGSLEPG